MDAFFCTDVQATPEPILAWVVRRWSIEVTCEEARCTPQLLDLYAVNGLVCSQRARRWARNSTGRETPEQG
jgi:hypothetical protein